MAVNANAQSVQAQSVQAPPAAAIIAPPVTVNYGNQQFDLINNPPNWPLMLSNLNTAQITSGILYNKVAMFSNLYDFNRGRYNVSHAEHFKQAINELYYASDQLKFMSATQLKQAIISTPTATIDIGIINTTIDMLNFNEKNPSTGGLTFPIDKFVPIAGQPAFVTRKILLAAPLKEMMSGTDVTYKFSSTLIYNNSGTTAIKNLVVYFNDNIPISIITNGVLVTPSQNVSYSTTGSKMLTFIATFTDNSTITTSGYHYFTFIDNSTSSAVASAGPCDTNLTDRELFKSDLPFKGYDESVAYYGKFQTTTFYHTKNGSSANLAKTVLKPVIVIDGFDPGDKRRTTDCDCEQDTSENGCLQSYSKKYFSLSQGFTYVFNPVEHESIVDNMRYNDVNSNGDLISPNFIDKLRDEGYDVIILNIPKYSTSAEGSTIENKAIDGGADYVERNAYTLASYLQRTKSLLNTNGSTNNIVIMGPSMGGLISRFALAYMEKRRAQATTVADQIKWQHNTRLWVSFDSPHLGANIPIGAQANIWFFGNQLRNSSAEEKFNNTLNSIAAKQMLISQFSNTLNTMVNGTGYSNNSPFFTRFQNSMRLNGVTGSSGFPVSVPGSFRKIAIANGSFSGVKNGVESDEFLNVRGYKDPTVTEGLITGALVGSVVPFVGTITGALIGGLLGASNANITLLRVRDKYYPGYGQSDDIFNGDGQNFKIGWSQWHINHKWYNLRGINNDLRGSLDVVPGGSFNTAKVIKDEIISGLDEAGLSNEVRTDAKLHAFIPVFSALAHLNPVQSWSNPLNYNLVCATNKQTPFDTYYGSTANTPHIFLTKEMVDWLMKEIGTPTIPASPQAPVFPLQLNLLTGPAVVCKNTTASYTFDDICMLPTAATWTVTPNLQINNSNGYNINVTALADGAATITATFQNGQTYSKTIWVGKPSFTFLSNNLVPEIISINVIGTNGFKIVNQNLTNVTWELISSTPNSCGTLEGSGLNGTIEYVNNPNPCRTNIKVTATNLCGSTSVVKAFVGRNCPNCPQRLSNMNIFTIFPNPSSEIVNIELRDQENIPEKNSVISGELFDMMGLSKSNIEIINNKAQINVSNFPRGIYILKINTDGVEEQHQIAVQ